MSRLRDIDCHLKHPNEAANLILHSFHYVHRISSIGLFSYCAYPFPLFSIHIAGSLATLSSQALTLLDNTGSLHERGNTQRHRAHCTDFCSILTSKCFQKVGKKAFSINALSSFPNEPCLAQSSIIIRSNMHRSLFNQDT